MVREVRQVLAIKAELGEHPLWNAKDQCLYWLDIEHATINRFDPASGHNTEWKLPDRPGCFAFREDGTALIAVASSFYEMNFATGALTPSIPAQHDPTVMRFNDGKTDRQGRFWVSTSRVDNDISRFEDNAYYRLDGNRLDKVLTGIGVPNGTAFSVDGRTMYRAQCEARKIWAYDYDPATGTPSNERLFVQVPDELGMPDGATVDSDDGYWVAMATPPEGGACGVARYTPAGQLDLFIPTPSPITTMVAFGGPDLSTLYITTGRLEALMPYETPEIAGSLFAVETGFRGVPEAPCRSG